VIALSALPTKEEIRQEMRRRRRLLSAAERSQVSSDLCARLRTDPEVAAILKARKPIAVYLASPEEIDLSDFISDALSAAVPVFAPKWNGRAYELARLTGLEPPHVVPGPHGILEPADFASPPQPPALWLVPGLAFSRSGHRIGYGGGWYDRLLSNAGGSLLLGVCHPFQVVSTLPSEKHDILIDRLFLSR